MQGDLTDKGARVERGLKWCLNVTRPYLGSFPSPYLRQSDEDTTGHDASGIVG